MTAGPLSNDVANDNATNPELRRRQHENGYEMYKNEKCTCKFVTFYNMAEIGSLLSNHHDDGNKNVTNLTVKGRKFAHFARAFFIFGHFPDALVLSTT